MLKIDVKNMDFGNYEDFLGTATGYKLGWAVGIVHKISIILLGIILP